MVPAPHSSPVREIQPDTEPYAYARLALIPGIGPKLIQHLLSHFGSAQQTLTASLSQLGNVERIGPRLASAIRDAARHDLLDRVLDHCKKHRVAIRFPFDDDFPKLLKELPDPPPLLFTRGEFCPEDQLAIGIVGSRHPTSYGRQVTESLTRSLAQAGLTIVSGLARGVDGIAHRTAMEVGGRTLALLGSSVTTIYPPEHSSLADQIELHGVVISETHPFAQPKAGVFPQRNRLISGLSLGVVVVEAAERSGALITAGHAGEQGRDIFAIPGPVTSRMSRGTNRLIRDGAILVQDAQDVIDHLGPLFRAARIRADKIVHHPAELKLNEQEQQVLQSIEDIPTDLDAVVHGSGLPVARVLATISVLETRRLIRRVGGRQVVRA